MFCCHRALRLEIFSLDIISFFFPKFLYCIFGKEFAINSLSNFTKHEFVISLRSRRRPGRQTFLLEVLWAGSHAYNFGKSFLTVRRALGTCGRVPWNWGYHMLFQILPPVFCNHIKLLFISGLRMQCSGRQCPQLPVDELPQITNSTADVNGCVSPCGFSNSLQSWQASS